MPDNENNVCRFCEGILVKKFNKKILNKYNIDYFECKTCYSLMSEKPYWLKEAYDDKSTYFDTGVFYRNWETFIVTFLVSRLFKFKNLIDYGGGAGLFTRICRDYNLNCYSLDKFSQTIYAHGFTDPEFDQLDLLTSFEVFEHFENPKDDLNFIFKKNPKAVLVTTVFYKNDGENWFYLELETGQHIFFYSKKAIQLIADKFNYNVYFFECGFTFFLEKEIKINKFYIFLLKKIIIRKKILKFLKILTCFFSEKGYENDYEFLKKKNY